MPYQFQIDNNGQMVDVVVHSDGSLEVISDIDEDLALAEMGVEVSPAVELMREWEDYALVTLVSMVAPDRVNELLLVRLIDRANNALAKYTKKFYEDGGGAEGYLLEVLDVSRKMNAIFLEVALGEKSFDDIYVFEEVSELKNETAYHYPSEEKWHRTVFPSRILSGVGVVLKSLQELHYYYSNHFRGTDDGKGFILDSVMDLEAGVATIDALIENNNKDDTVARGLFLRYYDREREVALDTAIELLMKEG